MAEWRSREGGPGLAERKARREEALLLHCQRVSPGCKAMIAYHEQVPWLFKSGTNRGAIIVCEDAFASLLRSPADLEAVRGLLMKNVRIVDAGTNIELGPQLVLLDRLARQWDQSAEIARLKAEMVASNDRFAREVALIGSRVATDMVSNGLLAMMQRAVNRAFAPQRDGASAPVSYPPAPQGAEGDDPVAQGPVLSPAD
jgi:hypothetical protein